MFRHVNQAFRVQDPGIDKGLVGDAAVLDQFRPKQVNPLSIGGMRHLVLVTAVTAEQLSIARYVEMDRPLVALEMIPGSFSGIDVVARQPEDFAARCLQVVPNGAAVVTPELVPGDFHRDGAVVNLGQTAAVAADSPDSIHLMPRPFVTQQ